MPALAIGRTYGNGNISPVRGWEGDNVLPQQNAWSLVTIAEVPDVFFTSPKGCANIFRNREVLSQKVFRIADGKKFIWIPALEIARFFLLKTVVNTRYAFYEGNLNAMASIFKKDEKLIIKLDRRYPKKLLDNNAHQEYLAWLILDESAKKSFSSIFAKRITESIGTPLLAKWTFNFEPFDLSGTRLYWRGEKLGSDYYVREIISASNIKSTVPYNTVYISHPNDIERKKGDKSDQWSEKSRLFPISWDSHYM